MSDAKDLPSKEEVDASGTTDWVAEAVREQKERYRDVAAALGSEREIHRQEKERLQGALDVTLEVPDPEGPPPDIFAAEREVAEKQRRGMAGLLDDFQKSQQAHREMFDIFGSDEKTKGK